MPTTCKSLVVVPGGAPVTPGTAAASSAASTALGVAEGCSPRYTAAAPVVWGAAIDVPLMVLVAVSEVSQSDAMLTPGANQSTQVPTSDHEAAASWRSLAATVITPGTRPGDDVQALRVWQGLIEAGRATPEIGTAVASYDADRVHALSYVLRSRAPDSPLVTLCLAVVDGLGVGLTRPGAPITREQAVDVVRTLASLISSGGAGEDASA